MKTVERSMNAERVSNVCNVVKDVISEGAKVSKANTSKAVKYINAHKRELITGAIEVTFIGGAIYFAIKGKTIYAIGSVCCALLTRHMVASGIMFYNGAKAAGNRIFRSNEVVKACDAETC